MRGELKGFAELVRRHDDGAAARALRYERLQHGDGAVVERGERFVEQQDFRIVNECACDGQALAHASREFADQAITDAFESGALQPFQGFLFGVFQTVEFCEEDEIFGGGQFVVKRNPVAKNADASASRCSRTSEP